MIIIVKRVNAAAVGAIGIQSTDFRVERKFFYFIFFIFSSSSTSYYFYFYNVLRFFHTSVVPSSQRKSQWHIPRTHEIEMNVNLFLVPQRSTFTFEKFSNRVHTMTTTTSGRPQDVCNSSNSVAESGAIQFKCKTMTHQYTAHVYYTSTHIPFTDFADCLKGWESTQYMLKPFSGIPTTFIRDRTHAGARASDKATKNPTGLTHRASKMKDCLSSGVLYERKMRKDGKKERRKKYNQLLSREIGCSVRLSVVVQQSLFAYIVCRDR